LGDSALDLLIVVFSLGVMIGSVLVWLSSTAVSREIVFLATTATLVVSMMLMVSVAVLVTLRLQRRVAHLEASLEPASNPSERAADGEVVIVTLTNVERRILNRLEENDGIMAQDDLRRATGLSKSTLSVSLSSLERKGLVHRETHGRTKIVHMKKQVRR